MRALVTGGAGFIGSNLATRLLRDGNEVVVLDDLSTGCIDAVPTDARFIRGSITDQEDLARSMRGVDVVYHNAAARAVLRSVEDPLVVHDVNAGGTLRVLLAARDAGVRRVILASSSSVYGDGASLPFVECAPLAPRSPYGVSKVTAEQYARLFWELFELQTVSLRYFNVFGPGQEPTVAHPLVIPLIISALMRGKPQVIHGDGSQFRDFTFIDDVVEASRLAAQAEVEAVAGRAFNIGRGEPHTVLEVLQAASSLLGIAASPTFVEARPGDVRGTHADISAARAAMGFEPAVDFEDGMARTVAWFTDHR